MVSVTDVNTFPLTVLYNPTSTVSYTQWATEEKQKTAGGKALSL